MIASPQPEHAMRLLLPLALLAATVSWCPAAPSTQVDDSAFGGGAFGDLGDGLLDDDLARKLSAPTPSGDGATNGGLLPDAEMLQRLLRQGAGEPVGEDVGESPLKSVVNGMRRAERLIQDDSDQRVAAPVQREVVAHLDRLIEQMQKQCQACNKSGSKDQKKQASKRSQPKEGENPGECDKPGESDKPGQKMAQNANKSGTTSLGGAPQAATPAEQQELMKAAWGHLPERMRERMLQGAGSEFLPEYRDELQQYYRKLAERTQQETP